MRYLNSFQILVAASLTAFPCGAAVAQQESGANGSPNNSLEEIVVTAERRSRNVQDIPISIIAFTNEQLVNKAVERQEDLQYAVPSLTITDAAITQAVNIRGIGLSSGDPNATNGVGTYIDGLFQPPIVSTLSFYDISDVQVLRGPQGTFSGANSTGGAIMINSRRPEIGGELNGYVRAGVGNYSAMDVEGALGLPLGDKFAVRAALVSRDRDSFYTDIGPANTDAGSLDEKRARLGLLWQPTENLDFYLKYETSEKDNGGLPNRPLAGSAFAFGRTADIRNISYNTNTRHEEDDDTLLLDSSFAFDNGVAVNLIAGMQEKKIDILWDYDSTGIVGLEQTQVIEEDQDSYELNLISPDDAKIQWVVGYYHQTNNIDVNIQTPGPLILIGIEKITKGLFGQVGFTVADDVFLEVGLRQAWFEAGGLPGSGGYFGPVANGPAFPINGQYDDDEILGKATASWNYNNDNLLYANVAKGYKPGGYNNPNPADNFRPESVWSYELGWKASAMDGAVRTSVAAFYNDYEDFQFDSIDIASGTNGIKNVGEATIQGLEFSIEGQFGGLRLDASLSLIDSDLSPASDIVNERALPPAADSLPQCAGGAVPPTCFDYTPYLISNSGGSNLRSPDRSLTVGAEYAFEMSAGATLTPRLNYGWIDEQWVNILYDPSSDLLDSRGLLSALITFEKENWVVQAYGRNLADKEYVSGQYLSLNVEYFGAPREYGIRATYGF